MSYIVEQTESFAKWHRELRDLRAKVAMARRITRAAKLAIDTMIKIWNNLS